MLIATDPLSLLFLACFLFGLLFLIVTTILGNLGHGQSIGHGSGHHVHLGGHIGGSTHHMISHSAASHRVDITHTPHTHSTAVTSAQTHTSTQGGFSLLSYLNPTTIVLFLLGFGFFGYVFHNLAAWALPLVLLGACIGGLAVTISILMLLARLFGDSEGETVQDVSDRVGLIGKVSLTIQEGGLGEILYVSPGGMRKSVPARSADGHRLERGQEVVVLNYEHGVAEVDTWEHFLEQEREQAGYPHTSAHTDSDVLDKLRTLLEESGDTDAQMIMRRDAQKE
jgi:hypothetical protein